MIVKIKNLKAEAIIGIHEWEKQKRRELIINLEMEFDGHRATASDDIADTLDYEQISQMLVEETEKSRFGLVERLASHLLTCVLIDARITRARIEIDKPGAVLGAESVSVVEEKRA